MTAVITTHARPVCVQRALESVHAEAHKDLEIIVVDDGGHFVPPPGARDGVRVVHRSGLGVARARNLGLAAARGEFIIYLDDDDVALPNRISSLLAAARQHRASLCFGMTRRVIDGAASMLPDVPTYHSSSANYLGISGAAVTFSDLLTCNPHVNAVLVKTETLRAVGGFDVGASHFDDWSAWLRIADGNTAVWGIDETVAEWRIHPQGLSGALLSVRAMKARLLSLFQRLEPDLSFENARAIALAERIVTSTDIVTYDDYVHAMTAARTFGEVAATPQRQRSRASSRT